MSAQFPYLASWDFSSKRGLVLGLHKQYSTCSILGYSRYVRMMLSASRGWMPWHAGMCQMGLWASQKQFVIWLHGSAGH